MPCDTRLSPAVAITLSSLIYTAVFNVSQLLENLPVDVSGGVSKFSICHLHSINFRETNQQKQSNSLFYLIVIVEDLD